MQPFLSCLVSHTFDSASRAITDSERSGRIDSGGHKITLTAREGPMSLVGEMIDRLRARLFILREDFGLRSMKTGTEVEDMSFAEISLLREISGGIVPLYVKIGGPEARNDIRNLIRIGVDGIIAPMVESPYSLKNFMATFEEICTERSAAGIEAGINLETITGYRQMHDILAEPLAAGLHQVTAARTDLSGSMGLHPDDDRVLAVCEDIVQTCRAQGLVTSVGGAIHPGIIDTLIERIASDRVNTRHMVLSCRDIARDPKRSLMENLRFEIDLYRALGSDPFNEKRDLHLKRYEVLSERLQKHAHFIG